MIYKLFHEIVFHLSIYSIQLLSKGNDVYEVILNSLYAANTLWEENSK